MPKKPPSTIDLNDVSDSDAPAPPETPMPMTRSERGLGWKKNPVDARDISARPLLGAPTNLPAEFYGLVAFAIAALDQSASSACVGFAICAAIMTRLRFLGIALAQVSPMAIYAWARMMGKASKDDRLLDDGSMPRLAMQAVREHGAPEEAKWPFDLGKINDELPWDVQQAASVGRITQFLRLDSDGGGLIHDIMHALVQNYPVVFGTFVDTAFMALGSASTLASAPVVRKVNLSDPRGGGHMLCIIGYRTNADGQIEFLLLNSWGLTWGYRGMAWMHQDVILDAESGDFYMMQVTTTGNAKTTKEEAA